MQIPKTVSSPADPDTPSLLTTLPAEIRNMIYELIFVKGEPVLLHNAEAFHRKEPERDLYFDDAQYAQEMDEFYEEYEREIGTDEKFHHDLHEGIGLLKSCRQLYHEVSGVLYGNNIFMISRVLDRCDDQELGNHDYEEYFQITYAARWLTSIGSQFAYLSKVIIDVDAMCPIGAECRLYQFDILRLVRLLWASPNQQHVITFGHSSRVLNEHDYPGAYCEYDSEDEELPLIDQATMLNSLLSAFVVDDTLGIRQCGKFRQLLDSVNIHAQEVDSGCVKYRCIKAGLDVERKFKISKEGTMLEWGPRSKPEFTSLPYHIIRRIYEFACYNPNGVTFDLNTRTVYGLNLGLFQVNMSVYKDYFLPCCVPSLTNVTLKMTSVEAVTDFGDFETLKDLLLENKTSALNSRIFDDIILENGTSYKPLTIWLEIAPPTATILSEVRINIKGLMVLLRSFSLHRKSTIRLVLRNKGQIQESVISTAMLQQGMFLLLSDAVEICKATLRGLKKRAPLPEIWIDGCGNLINASFPGDSLPLGIKYRYTKLNKDEVRIMGYRKATSLAETFDKYGKLSWPNESSHPDMLMSAWHDFRWMHWGDWWERGARKGLKNS